MNRISFLLFAIAIIAIGGGATWYLVNSRNEAFGPAPVATSMPTDMREGLAIYTNGPYGFTVFYPESAAVEYGFDTSYHLGTNWRAHALPDTQGAPIVAIMPYSIRSEDSYPRYFNAMVRIGASSDPKEIARCTEADTSAGETTLADRTIGGRVWKAFAFESAGMMQYAIGVSYRTVHEDRCIALEQVRTGSNYREEGSGPADIDDTTLLAEYDKLSLIIESFSFAR